VAWARLSGSKTNTQTFVQSDYISRYPYSNPLPARERLG
jgi:hypothetical protein